MRKLLTILLFLPLTLIGQATSTGAHGGSSSDGLDIDLVYKGIVGNADQPLSKVQVNDTIVLALKLNNLDTIHQITYIHTDVQYNSAAYALLSTDWNTPTDAQNSVGNWSGNGMKMVWSSDYDKNAVWAQWQHGSYTGDQSVAAGWQVDHIQSIAPTDIGSVEYATMKYLVKDAGANADYTENIIITMARAADNILTDNADTNGDGNNDEYVYPTGKVRAYDTQYITHTPLEDLDSNIYVKLDANGNIDLTKIKVKVIEDGTEVADLAFDTGGEVNITDYIISSTKTYKLEFHTTYTDSEWQTITEDAVTLSDAVLTLKEVGKFGHGGATHDFDYGIQYPNADTDGSKTINPQDAYNILGHVIGSFNYYPGNTYAFASTFPIVKTATYDGYTKQNFLDGVTIDSAHDKTIQSSDVTNVINWTQSTNTLSYKSTILGDVNLSYSSTPASDGAGVMSISNAPKVTMNPLYISNENEIFGVGVAKQEVNQAFIDINTAIEDGEVVTTLQLTSDQVAGFQLKLNYDTTRLTFDRVKFETGNTTTNFAHKADDGRINLGSLQQEATALENGATVKVYFTGQVTSPVGTVTIFQTDAVNTEGKRLILNLQ
jgi:hypothetical protein